jgi:hypothetical protein
MATDEANGCYNKPQYSEACIAPNYCKDTSTDRDNLSAECSACTDFGYISFGSDANAYGSDDDTACYRPFGCSGGCSAP